MNNPILQMLGIGNNNPMLQMLMSAQSPQQMLTMIMQQYPQAQQALNQLGPNPTPQSMEQLCQQLCQQRGLDFNSVKTQAQQMMNNKRF
jgi:hypothetical protein